MSNEQTVAQTIATGIDCGDTTSDICADLGIDLDMERDELVRRLKIADAFDRDVLKVVLCDCMLAINADAPQYPPIIPPTAIDWIGDRLVAAVLARMEGEK